MAHDQQVVEHTTAAATKDSRTFSISRNGVTLELASRGAQLARLYVPGRHGMDNVVLGVVPNDGGDTRDNADNDDANEVSPMFNPSYFGVIVGRVANRIANGVLEYNYSTTTANNSTSAASTTPTIHRQLERNNWPNHLHGGSGGFSEQIWDAQPLDDGVEFTLTSPAGDQNYPGTVQVTATYRLLALESSAEINNKLTITSADDSHDNVYNAISRHGVRIALSLRAQLLDDTPSPINLANHAYWNLQGHKSSCGILNHELQLSANSYTPVNAVSIPTREIQSLDDDASWMDWREPRTIREGLVAYAVAAADQTKEQAQSAIQARLESPTAVAISGPQADPPSAPYGFDHNYVVARRQEDGDQSSMAQVGTLWDPVSQRQLTVRSTAPGVQIYTANYLDGTDTPAAYGQWQAVCLETQHYPDSVTVDPSKHPEFHRGKCVVLTPESNTYQHDVEYQLEFPYYAFDNSNSNDDDDDDTSNPPFTGSDTDGNVYSSVRSMWRTQGVHSVATAATEWYDRAADYYATHCPPTMDGVLGGFANLTDSDLRGSKRFLQDVRRLLPDWNVANGATCECGAGIGRVTRGLLADLGKTSRCDLVESSPDLIAAAPEHLGAGLAARCRFYCEGLQEWTPPANADYSIIWIQWVFCYLTDDDAVAFLQRCAAGLSQSGGIIVLKENVCDDQDFVVDAQDASVSRSIRYLHWIAQRAGLVRVHASVQDDFPDQIFPVYQIALRSQHDAK